MWPSKGQYRMRKGPRAWATSSPSARSVPQRCPRFPEDPTSPLSRYLQGCPQFLGIEMGCWLQQGHHDSLEVTGQCRLQGCQQVLQGDPMTEEWK